MTHPLEANTVKAAARDTRATAEGKDCQWLQRDKYRHIGTGACRVVLLSHETFGRAGPAVFAFLNEIEECAASSGVASKRKLWENAIHYLSKTLCQSITQQVLAVVPLCARLNGHPVVAGLPVPTNDLIPVNGAGRPDCRSSPLQTP